MFSKADLVIDTRMLCYDALEQLVRANPSRGILLIWRDVLVYQTERLVKGGEPISPSSWFGSCQYLITEIDAATGYGH